MSMFGRFITLAITIAWLALGRIGGGETLTQEPKDAASTSFARVLNAHGGPQAIAAAQSVTSIMTRVSWDSPAHSFERQVELSTNDDKFVRKTTDRFGTRTEIEVYDGADRLRAVARVRTAGNQLVEDRLVSDTDRLKDIQASNLSTGLLPILKFLIEPQASVSRLSRDSNGFSRFRVATSRGTFIVHAGRANLISKVNLGSTTMEFADTREVATLKLPFAERVVLGDRILFDLYFAGIELRPALPGDYFDPARLDRL